MSSTSIRNGPSYVMDQYHGKNRQNGDFPVECAEDVLHLSRFTELIVLRGRDDVAAAVAGCLGNGH
jgi:hypothetical protein